ncbi:hypothetical protein PHPALM_30595 [Phytophthora palmivora]|uniref:Uncharacterized protein n=1 Tax=Phytophthora palmivora TaxID=4796 RepID=A0A2P4X4T3_9STRA|nr:hypothetical protein PHPALM_30595 [Phytophthora palmivora]
MTVQNWQCQTQVRGRGNRIKNERLASTKATRTMEFRISSMGSVSVRLRTCRDTTIASCLEDVK